MRKFVCLKKKCTSFQYRMKLTEKFKPVNNKCVIALKSISNTSKSNVFS